MILTEEIKAYFNGLGYDKYIETDKSISIIRSKNKNGQAINITKHDKGVRKEDNLGQALKIYPKELIGLIGILKRL